MPFLLSSSTSRICSSQTVHFISLPLGGSLLLLIQLSFYNHLSLCVCINCSFPTFTKPLSILSLAALLKLFLNECYIHYRLNHLVKYFSGQDAFLYPTFSPSVSSSHYTNVYTHNTFLHSCNNSNAQSFSPGLLNIFRGAVTECRLPS